MDGTGVIIAVIDSGIDYSLPEFIDGGGKTKIVRIYDVETGMTYSRDMINEALGVKIPLDKSIVPINDMTGHGTAVAAIAMETSPGAELLVIRLGKSPDKGFLLSTRLMRGIDYAIKYAIDVNKPIAINISYGNTYGNHKGDSLIEKFIDNASQIGKASIIVGAGNEGNAKGHVSGIATQDKAVELIVEKYETGFSLQIWKYYQDAFDISITSPGGEKYTIKNDLILKSEVLRIELDDTDLLCYIGKPKPYNVEQEIFVDFVPKEDYVTNGVWIFTFLPVAVVTGEYRMYLSGYSTRNMGTGFVNQTLDMTMTIPSTSQKVITVGAYDEAHNTYADFSGRGYIYRYGETGQKLIATVKPDVVAPGVNITVPIPGGGYEKVSGTSFAAPYVTGLCALLMQRGIVLKNDIYMYGDRLKAYLISKAVPLEPEDEHAKAVPNSKIGWGKVDFLRKLLYNETS